MSNEILFYDLSIQSSVRPNKCFSQNTLPVRYAFNYKELPYKTVWIEFHEIEPVARKLGAKPTKIKPNGEPWYTVSFIRDQFTGIVISNSFNIVQYLDKQYPSLPRVVIPGTLASETAYCKYFYSAVRCKWPRSMHQDTYETISPESAAFIKESREVIFGDNLINITLSIYEKAEGIFLKGSKPGWGDFVPASSLLCIKLLYGGDSKEWKYIETWHEGRWVKLIKDLEPYGHIDE